jgi:hypothetical protein
MKVGGPTGTPPSTALLVGEAVHRLIGSEKAMLPVGSSK